MNEILTKVKKEIESLEIDNKIFQKRIKENNEKISCLKEIYKIQ
jgi:hypothetical protein